MIYTRLNRTGGIESIKVHGGGDVAEVYGSINEENPIYYKTRTLTGTPPLNFKALGNPLSDYLISGNAVQNGTPTPESPIYPQECGDRTGNLLNNNNIVSGGWDATKGTNPEPNANPRRCRYNHFFAVASKTILYDFKDLSIKIVMMNSDGLSLGATRFLSGVGNITLLNNTEKISLIIAKSDNTEDITVDYARSKNISLDYGYKLPLNLNGTPQNIYLTEPLRKIGDYADTVNSDGTVTRRIGKLVLTGEESWEFYSDSGSAYGAWQFFYGNMLSGLPSSSAMSNIAGYGVIVDTRGRYPYGVYLVVGGTKVAFQMAGAKDTFTGITSWKKYLAQQYANGTPVTVWYVLAEPTTEQVTAPTLTPATGNNTLAIGTTLQPSSVSITGHIKPTT